MKLLDKLFRRPLISGGCLTHGMIQTAIEASGQIGESKFIGKNINANSYDLRIGSTMTVYSGATLFDLHDTASYASKMDSYTIGDVGQQYKLSKHIRDATLTQNRGEISDG